MILAPLHFLDHRLVAATGKRPAQILEPAMQPGRQRSLIFRLATHLADLFLQSPDNLPAFLREVAEHPLKRRAAHVLGRSLIAVGAVDRGRDQLVDDCNVIFFIVEHSEFLAV